MSTTEELLTLAKKTENQGVRTMLLAMIDMVATIEVSMADLDRRLTSVESRIRESRNPQQSSGGMSIG